MKKHKIISLFVLAVVCMLPAQMAFGQFSGGAGTEGDPWRISTTGDLATCDNLLTYYDDYFILINDIDVTGETSWPLFPRGDETRVTKGDGLPAVGGGAVTFGGTFDGDGYAIINKTNSLLDQMWSPYNGGPAIIKNLTLSNVNITTHGLIKYGGWGALTPSEYYANKDHRIINVHVSGIISNTGSSVGGLMGSALGASFSNCTSSAKIYAASSVGGLLGAKSGASTVTVCSASGDVWGSSTSVGGLIGLMSGGLVYRCWAGGDVTRVSSEYVGGLIGLVTGGSTVRECFATGDVYRVSAGQGGGLVGGTEDNGAGEILIEDCYSTGNNGSTVQQSPGRNGGFVGNFGRDAGARHLINRCYSKGDVGSTIGGGFMGRDSGGGNASLIIISNSYASGSTVANSAAGFAVSAGFGVTIENCFWTNSATSDPIATKVGSEEYFYDSDNSPFETWDAETVWYFSGDADPRLRWDPSIVYPVPGVVIVLR